MMFQVVDSPTCRHGQVRGRCIVTMYCVDLDRHVRAEYDEPHQCDTWWFCPGGSA